MLKSLASALVVCSLLGGAPTKAVIAATTDSLVIPNSHAPIVKVEEACGNGFFRDGHGHCLQWYGGEPAHRPHEGCPPDRHFVHWSNHDGGFCKLDY
jgi:hypothetical protein